MVRRCRNSGKHRALLELMEVGWLVCSINACPCTPYQKGRTHPPSHARKPAQPIVRDMCTGRTSLFGTISIQAGDGNHGHRPVNFRVYKDKQVGAVTTRD